MCSAHTYYGNFKFFGGIVLLVVGIAISLVSTLLFLEGQKAVMIETISSPMRP